MTESIKPQQVTTGGKVIAAPQVSTICPPNFDTAFAGELLRLAPTNVELEPSPVVRTFLELTISDVAVAIAVQL